MRFKKFIPKQTMAIISLFFMINVPLLASNKAQEALNELEEKVAGEAAHVLKDLNYAKHKSRELTRQLNNSISSINQKMKTISQHFNDVRKQLNYQPAKLWKCVISYDTYYIDVGSGTGTGQTKSEARLDAMEDCASKSSSSGGESTCFNDEYIDSKRYSEITE